jgi:hypothetical protein
MHHSLSQKHLRAATPGHGQLVLSISLPLSRLALAVAGPAVPVT